MAQRTESKAPAQSASYMRALDRAMMRGDSERVSELYAVPQDERATWTPSSRRSSPRSGRRTK